MTYTIIPTPQLIETLFSNSNPNLPLNVHIDFYFNYLNKNKTYIKTHSSNSEITILKTSTQSDLLFLINKLTNLKIPFTTN